MLNTENPLLEIAFNVPFERIQTDHIERGIEELLKAAQEELRAIGAETNPSFGRTMQRLDVATERLDYAMTIVAHLESVATSDALRTVYNVVQPKVSEFYSNIPLDPTLWTALTRYSETDEAKTLAGARKRFLEKTVADFRRQGAALPEEGKRRLAEISVELAKLTTKYSQNVLDSTNRFELVLSKDELGGLPESAVESARASALAKGLEGYRFTLQGPSYLAVMTHLDNRSIRERVYRAYHSRATHGELDNRSLIDRILTLRKEQASLLGYRNFADFVLEDRMAKTGTQAREFVQLLSSKTRPFFEKETAELEAFARELGIGHSLAPWDIAYVAEKQRKALYDFDEELLRPYFPVDSVLVGLFEIVRRLYGVVVKSWEGASTWDPKVKTYLLYDEQGECIAGFYVDLYPRENKRDGAWMNAFLTHRSGGPPHIGLMCANVSPAVGNRPALLTHREVETLFHEFGHLLHHCLTTVELRSLAGTQVAWDFVELPSQIMENWCWERDALDLFAKHWQTGEPVPDALFQRMRSARNFRSASAMMRQLGLAAVDLSLHCEYQPDRDGDLLTYARAVMQSYSTATLPDDYAMIASFGHLFADAVGYAAGYYSYKWAEVLDADAFTRFAERGVFSREVGQEFRNRILAKGNSQDPLDLFVSFMGREPSVDALLERSGLCPSALSSA